MKHIKMYFTYILFGDKIQTNLIKQKNIQATELT